MALVTENVKTDLRTTLDAALAITDPEQRAAALDAWCGSVASIITGSIKTGIDDTQVSFTLATPTETVTGTITLTAQVT